VLKGATGLRVDRALAPEGRAPGALLTTDRAGIWKRKSMVWVFSLVTSRVYFHEQINCCLFFILINVAAILFDS